MEIWSTNNDDCNSLKLPFRRKNFASNWEKNHSRKENTNKHWSNVVSKYNILKYGCMFVFWFILKLTHNFGGNSNSFFIFSSSFCLVLFFTMNHFLCWCSYISLKGYSFLFPFWSICVCVMCIYRISCIGLFMLFFS